ncbi:unnamed protein product [Linum tenue]|uniref:Uncharacterized protein n=1 Tax=Linum tenue TaxID=586396 RepID=A0AAV0R7W3_9ROSI|nr:unnamed protein product [Linum tenue]
MESLKMMTTRKAALPFAQLIAVLFIVLIILFSAVPAESARQLLQRGSRVPSGPNGCSHVAGSVSCIGQHG